MTKDVMLIVIFCHSEAILIELRFSFALHSVVVGFFGRNFNFLNFCEISNELSTTVVNVKCMSFIRWLFIVFLSEKKKPHRPGRAMPSAVAVNGLQTNIIDRKNESTNTTEKEKKQRKSIAKNICSMSSWMANDISIVLFGECFFFLCSVFFFFQLIQI